MNKKSFLLFCVTPVVVAIGFGSYVAQRGWPDVSPAAAVMITKDASSWDLEQPAQLTAAGRHTVALVESALLSLDAKNTDAAKQYLFEARVLLERIKTEHNPDILPIQAQFEFADGVRIDNTVQTQFRDIGRHIMRGDRDKIIEILESTGVPLDFTYVTIPLAETIAHVDAALMALDELRPDKARKAALAVSSSLKSDTVKVCKDCPGGAG